MASVVALRYDRKHAGIAAIVPQCRGEIVLCNFWLSPFDLCCENNGGREGTSYIDQSGRLHVCVFRPAPAASLSGVARGPPPDLCACTLALCQPPRRSLEYHWRSGLLGLDPCSPVDIDQGLNSTVLTSSQPKSDRNRARYCHRRSILWLLSPPDYPSSSVVLFCIQLTRYAVYALPFCPSWRHYRIDLTYHPSRLGRRTNQPANRPTNHHNKFERLVSRPLRWHPRRQETKRQPLPSRRDRRRQARSFPPHQHYSPSICGRPAPQP